MTWNVKTKPILFGETLELVCKIFDEKNLCKGSFQQWYGTKQDTLLCQDGKCRNEEKYTFKKNANCSNSLLIHNLTISDVDISYSCAFGRNEMKKGLMMEDYEFLSKFDYYILYNVCFVSYLVDDQLFVNVFVK